MYKIFMVLCLIMVQFFTVAFANYVEETLTNIELKQYGKSYIDDSIGSRLGRLEIDFFGMAQSGSVENRLYTLEKISSVNKYVPQFQEDLFGDKKMYLNEEKPSKLKQFFNVITYPFDSSGTVTGYTPPLYCYNNHYVNSNSRYFPHQKYHHSNLNRKHYHHYPYYRTDNYQYQRPENTFKNIATRAAINILD